MALPMRPICCVCATLLVVCLLGGCNKLITAKTARKNFSPSLQSSISTGDQQLNTGMWVHDMSKRQLEDDLTRILMSDRPSLLTPYPVP